MSTPEAPESARGVALVCVTATVAGMVIGACVRAPLTGLVLVVEMTASTAALVPMLAATGAAVLTAQVVGSAPIYDSLRQRGLVKT